MARILVAEDEALIRLFVVDTLVSMGHSVLEAPDGQVALDVINDGSELDLLVSDIRLPKMDGISLALAAHRKRPQMTVVFLTGNLRVELPGELSGTIVITKPFDSDTFAAKITAALGIAGSATGG